MVIPKNPWRLGEEYLVTDFVQVGNVAIKEKAKELFATGGDRFVENVSSYVRDEFYYPLDNSGNPAASGQFMRHQKSWRSYAWKKCVSYMWSLPNETMVIGAGICVDTGNLGASLLRAEQLKDTWACLGSVMSTNGQLLGRHEWVSCHYKGEQYVFETTVHEEGVNNLIKASDIYNRDSDWAKDRGLYYELEARFDESEYIGVGPLGQHAVMLMGLPANRVLLFGIEGTACCKQKQLQKEWRQEERIKTRLLVEAYRGVR